MARELLVNVKCDRCGKDANNSHADTRFAWQGIEYHIDLCDGCHQEIDTSMTDFTQVAERSERRAKRLNRERTVSGQPYLDSPKAVRPQRDVDYLAKVREWAKANGHNISSRGRVPNHIEEAYQQATHGQ